MQYFWQAALFSVAIPFFFITVFFYSPKVTLTSLDFNGRGFIVVLLLFLAATIGLNELLEWIY